jgi:YidC/Oxa1 family membrane protein insertase
MVYAGMWGAWNEAIVVRPADGSAPFAAKTEVRQAQIKQNNQTATVDQGVVTLTLPGNTTTKLRFYGGPHELVRLDLEGHASLPGYFQPNIFGQLSLGLLGILKAMHNTIGSWGLTIIAFTILLRLVLWPLLHTQLRSSAEMQALQPKMNEIREKYKSDPQKQQTEMAKLYQENKVNPFAGCGPLFLQMPILIVLWRVFANYEFDQGFLWLRDLALPDNLLILPLLYVLVNIAQTYYYTKNNPEMFRTQIFVQLIFVYLTLQFPSGVTLYYVLSTVIQVAQQWYINKQLGVTPAQMPSMSSMMKSMQRGTENKTVEATTPKKK